MTQESIAVIDFETNGLSPNSACRPTEIAVTLIKNGVICDRFQSLMNSGVWIPPNIEALTGITNRMIKEAPPANHVMRNAINFIGNSKLVAHNASFDSRFFHQELALLGINQCMNFVCTLLLSRRVYPNAPNYKLSTLKDCLELPFSGTLHRAQADADLCSNLYLRICDDLMKCNQQANFSHNEFLKLQRQSKSHLAKKISIPSASLYSTDQLQSKSSPIPIINPVPIKRDLNSTIKEINNGESEVQKVARKEKEESKNYNAGTIIIWAILFCIFIYSLKI